jgi:hypothetical protein
MKIGGKLDLANLFSTIARYSRNGFSSAELFFRICLATIILGLCRKMRLITVR